MYDLPITALCGDCGAPLSSLSSQFVHMCTTCKKETPWELNPGQPPLNGPSRAGKIKDGAYKGPEPQLYLHHPNQAGRRTLLEAIDWFSKQPGYSFDIDHGKHLGRFFTVEATSHRFAGACLRVGNDEAPTTMAIRCHDGARVYLGTEHWPTIYGQLSLGPVNPSQAETNNQ